MLVEMIEGICRQVTRQPCRQTLVIGLVNHVLLKVNIVSIFIEHDRALNERFHLIGFHSGNDLCFRWVKVSSVICYCVLESFFKWFVF